MFCSPFLKLSEPVAPPKRSARDAAAQKFVPGCAPKLQCSPQGSRRCRRRSGEQYVAIVWRFAEPGDPLMVRRVTGAARIVLGFSRSRGKGSGAPGSAPSCLGRLGERLEKIFKELLQIVTNYYKLLQIVTICSGLKVF